MKTRIEDTLAGSCRFADVEPLTWFRFLVNTSSAAGMLRLQNNEYLSDDGFVHEASPGDRVVQLELAGVKNQTLLLRRVEG